MNGLISPLDDVNPEDIGIDKLLDHLNKNDYKEIILAFKPNVEGEITSLYIKKNIGKYWNKNYKVSKWSTYWCRYGIHR